MSSVHTHSDVVVLRLSAIGDVAMTLPYLYDVAQSNPLRRFYLVTRPFMAKLLVGAPSNLQPLAHDFGQQGQWYHLIKLAWQLHREHPRALIVDLHDVLRTKLIRCVLRMLGHHVVVLQKPRRERRALLKRDLSRALSLSVPRMVDLYGETLQRAGLEHHGGVAIRLGTKRQRAIGFAPFAQHQGKRLTESKAVALLQAITQHFPQHEIILYGAPGSEKETLTQWVQQLDNAQIHLTHAQGIASEITEISTLDAMVSMDSANTHLAAMLATPTVSLWGATHPAAGFRAWGTTEEDCIGSDLVCRPCSIYGAKPCFRKDYACIEQLDIDAVITRLRNHINNQP